MDHTTASSDTRRAFSETPENNLDDLDVNKRNSCDHRSDAEKFTPERAENSNIIDIKKKPSERNKMLGAQERVTAEGAVLSFICFLVVCYVCFGGDTIQAHVRQDDVGRINETSTDILSRQWCERFTISPLGSTYCTAACDIWYKPSSQWPCVEASDDESVWNMCDGESTFAHLCNWTSVGSLLYIMLLGLLALDCVIQFGTVPFARAKPRLLRPRPLALIAVLLAAATCIVAFSIVLFNAAFLATIQSDTIHCNAVFGTGLLRVCALYGTGPALIVIVLILCTMNFFVARARRNKGSSARGIESTFGLVVTEPSPVANPNVTAAVYDENALDRNGFPGEVRPIVNRVTLDRNLIGTTKHGVSSFDSLLQAKSRQIVRNVNANSEEGNSSRIASIDAGRNGYIEQGSARLSNTDTRVRDSFSDLQNCETRGGNGRVG